MMMVEEKPDVTYEGHIKKRQRYFVKCSSHVCSTIFFFNSGGLALTMPMKQNVTTSRHMLCDNVI